MGLVSPHRITLLAPSYVNLEGYETTTKKMNAGLNRWTCGNIVFIGLIGALIVDPATGCMYRLPANVSVTLNPTSAPPHPAASTPETPVTAAIPIDTLTPEQVARLIPIYIPE